MSVIWIGDTYSRVAWFNCKELETVDNLANLLTRGLANFIIEGGENADKLFVNSVLVKKGKVLAHIRKMANEIIFDSEETIRVESNLPEINTKYKGYRIYSSPLYVKVFNGHIELPDRFMSISEAKVFINS